MLQQYGGVGQGLLGATSPAVSRNPAPPMGSTSGVSSGALDVSGAAKGSQLGYSNRLAQKRRQRGELPEEETATKPAAPQGGTGGGVSYGSAGAKTPLLQGAIGNSAAMAAAKQALQSRTQAPAPAQAAQRSAPDNYLDRPSFGDDPSGLVNRRNPTMNPDLPFVQRGTTGGYLEGVGITIGPGRSITPALAQQQKLQALQQGIDPGWIESFLQRNPGDTNRIIEGYQSENTNSRKGSWQDYALPSAEEAAAHFGVDPYTNSAAPAAPVEPAGPSEEEIRAQIRAEIEEENRKAAEQAIRDRNKKLRR